MKDVNDEKITFALGLLNHAVSEKYGSANIQRISIDATDVSTIDKRKFVFNLRVDHSQVNDVF